MARRLIGEGRPAEVLLIDDSRGDALLAERAFRDATFETRLTVVRTGEDALDVLSAPGTTPPDLILLDMGLPKLSGTDVLAAIKGNERLKATPVVVMSNSGAPPNVLRAYNLYASAYIVKPVNLDAYREAIALIEQFFFSLASLPNTRAPLPFVPQAGDA
jgi:CheY-like chemotaxis protein